MRFRRTFIAASYVAVSLVSMAFGTLIGAHHDRIGLELDTLGWVRVIEATDGDTIVVHAHSGRKIKLRLIGLDTPETKDRRKAVGCFGPEASKRSAELLEGRLVWLSFDSKAGVRDIYQRPLAYVFTGVIAQTNINKTLLQEGYAREYRYKNERYRYREEFRRAQDEAYDKRKGLWGACDYEKRK